MIEITPLGDAALTVRFSKTAAKSPNERLTRVLAAKRAIDRASIPGVVETTTSYSTLGIFLDMPALLGRVRDPENVFQQVTTAIHEVLAQRGVKKATAIRKRRVDIFVCFDSAFALDLAGLAESHNLTSRDVVKKFCAATYQVASVGFTPGFPYLIGLPPELKTPRRETPRVSVPAGSVAIGNDQAGIYPMESPGGWNVIGRTPLLLFEASREPASLLSPGDYVRFHAVSIDEFHKIRKGPAGLAHYGSQQSLR